MEYSKEIQDALYEALKHIVDWMEKWDKPEWNFDGMLVDGRKALAEAEVKNG